MKYSKEDIFQILIDLYNFQTAFDIEVDEGFELSFLTSIEEWVEACDLVGPKKLTKHYYQLFELTSNYAELEYIFLNGKDYNLEDLCQYLADNAIRKEIKPIVLFGRSCKSAAVFKTLKSELVKRGVNADFLKPSSEILPFFSRHGGILLDVVNKIAPGSLTNFEYENNRPTSVGMSIVLISLFLMIPVSIFWTFHWTFFTPIIVGFLLVIIGGNMKPKKYSVGFNTFRELIHEMENNLESKPLVN